MRTAIFCARTALFSGSLQQVAELNDTAALLWRWVGESRTPHFMIAALVEQGADASDAHSVVAQALDQWLRAGFIAPSALLDTRQQPPHTSLGIRIGDFRADIAFHGGAAPEITDVFAHLVGDETTVAPIRLSVFRRQGVDFLFEGPNPAGVCEAKETAPRLKALLTEAYCDSIDDGFLAHGALIDLHGKTIFLGGEPGAGKTTLTLALCLAGAGFCGDDIVRVSPKGHVTGAPFAAALKTGAWPLLAGRMPDLATLPVHERTDGQSVRYIAAALGERAPRPLDAVVFLKRDGGPATLAPLDKLDALCRFIDSSYARSGALDADTFAALAARFAAIPCVTLNTGDLDETVALLQDMAHEQGTRA